jgi:predicted DNA-binding transcriptional regulator AlpA
MTNPERLLRIRQVAEMVGLSPRQVYRLISEGQFPAQRRLSHKVAVWSDVEVSAWIAKRWEDAGGPSRSQSPT